jgi:tetratricopeptide (TPR) repeat protein
VDRNSPYYSPGNKGTVYFAESRVLAHYLISDPEFAGSKAMERYIAAVEGGADSLKAARDAFGDLTQLQAKLDAFVKNVSGPPAEIPVPAASDSGGAPRTLSMPEIEAREADFLALRGRSDDAQDKLEEALMAEPTLAEAEQCLGFLALRKDDQDEAEKNFERAVQLNPNDGLNYYGQGLVAMAKSGGVGIPAEAANSLEKSVALNPDFAPAWENLATIYSQKNETLAKALADAQRAASLAPGDSHYQLQVAALLNQLGHPEEARKTAARVQETAGDRATANKAGDLVARINPRQPPAAPGAARNASATPPPASTAPASTSSAPSKSTSDTGLRIERKTEPGAASSSTASSTTASAKTEPAPAPVPPLFEGISPVYTTQTYSMMGTITEVNCSGTPQVQVTLKSQNIVMKLHADDLDKVSIKSAGAAASSKSPACASLRGRTARISYHLVSGKTWDGEMQAVEFRALPAGN